MQDHRCPICQSGKISIRPPYYVFRDRQYDLHECGDCGVFFVWPQPDAETLKIMYGKEYFERDFHCGHSGHSAYEHRETALPDWVKKIGLKPPAEVMEIGCATGYQLKAFRDAGYGCTGIEISDDAADYARREHGLNVVTATLEDADPGNQQYDAVYLHDVFEHLNDPVSALRKIRQWLNPGGFAVIVIPTQTNTLFSRIGIRLYTILNKRTRVMLPPYHVFEYRPKSFRKMLNRTGFRDVRLYPAVMKPSEIALRGPFIQRMAKKTLHFPNYLLSRITGWYGDRLTMIVKR